MIKTLNPIKSFRDLVAHKARTLNKQLKDKSMEHDLNLRIYGFRYRNTLGHDSTVLTMKWMALKIAIYSSLSGVNNI